MLSIAIIVGAQAVATIAPPPIDFDLGKVAAPPPCSTGGTDIVVCARTRDRPVQTLPEIDIPPPPKAEIKLFGNVKAGAGLEGATVGGFQSKRAMVKVKVPL